MEMATTMRHNKNTQNTQNINNNTHHYCDKANTATATAATAHTQNCCSSAERPSTKERSNRNGQNNNNKNNNNNKQQQKIKISKKNKLKFFINLYIKLILCISELNKSMLQIINYNNYQKCMYIKLLEKAKSCKISFESTTTTKLPKTTTINHHLTKLKRCYRTIENVKIRQILPIVRHFVGICLIRLISLKRFQKQIPQTHFKSPDIAGIRKENKQKYQIVGSTRIWPDCEKRRNEREWKNHITARESSGEQEEGERKIAVDYFYKINRIEKREYAGVGKLPLLHYENQKICVKRHGYARNYQYDFQKRQNQIENSFKRVNGNWINSQNMREIDTSALNEEREQPCSYDQIQKSQEQIVNEKCYQYMRTDIKGEYDFQKRQNRIEKSQKRRDSCRVNGNGISSQNVREIDSFGIIGERDHPSSQEQIEKCILRKEYLREIGHSRNYQYKRKIFKLSINEEREPFSPVDVNQLQERQDQIETSIQERAILGAIIISRHSQYLRDIIRSLINEHMEQPNTSDYKQNHIAASIQKIEYLRVIDTSKLSQYLRDIIRSLINEHMEQPNSFDFKQTEIANSIERREYLRVIITSKHSQYLRDIIRSFLNEHMEQPISFDFKQNQIEKSKEKREYRKENLYTTNSQYLSNLLIIEREPEFNQINGNSTNYEYPRTTTTNQHPCKVTNNTQLLASHYFHFNQTKANKDFQIIANLQQYQHFNDFNVTLRVSQYHLSSSELLLRHYHKEKAQRYYRFYHSSHNNFYPNSRQRQNQHFKQQQQQQQQQQLKCERECHRFLFIYSLFCSGSCWHICGFPLVSQDIFKYLTDLTVRMLATWLQIRPADVKNVEAAVTSERKLKNTTTAATKVKTQIIANQEDLVKIPTHTATSSLVFATKAPTLSTHSSSSFSSSTSLATSTSSQKTPCFQQHYQRQQQHPQSQFQPQPQHTPTAAHLKLPSWLLLSRTLIILILLSSLWHTSEGFHGTGIKLSPNTVKTKYGLVRGIVVRSSPSLVEAYLGIPYASPPVGSLRFMPPITPSTWKTVRNADRFSPVCPQTVPIPPNGPEALLEVPRARLAQLRRLLPLLSNQSEDCLYLNIYVPYENRRHRRFTTNSGEQNDTPKLPIILFIHGESYEWNSGNPYDGSELAAHGNVIVVTINFRLGIFGFLKTGGKESAQGNFGLMDLVAGLHFLKENLPAFGGDPQAITLLGHGTGAALANILMVSPVASDLIQHCVLVSGSALSPWAIQKNPLFVKRRVAEQTGCHGDMLYDDLAPCLRTKSVAELLTVKIDHPRFLVGFAPFIDGTVISPNTDSIGKLSLPLGSAIVSTSGIEFANFPKRNLIFCLTSVESHLDLSAQDLEFGFNETRRDRILRTYVRNNFHYHLNEIFAVLKNEYTDWDKAIRSPLSARDATLQFLSDGHTASSLIKLGYMHGLRGGRGYFLHFKHRTVEEEYPQRTGSVRGEDVPFWLGLPISPLFPHNYTAQEKQISRLMLKYLANFAKTGNPNQATSTSVLPSSFSLIALPASPSTSSSSSSHVADDHRQVKRSSVNIVNATSAISGPTNTNSLVVDVETAATREALNLAVLYNQRRTKRTYYKRHSRSNDDHNGSGGSSEIGYFPNANNKLDGDEMPFWDAYDVVNQLYMELGNKAEIQSHYRGHKLSMWLNLIPQLHRHANMNDQSMRHHQFQDDLNNLNLYEGIVRAQIQTKPADDEDTLLLPKVRATPPPPVVPETNTTQKPSGVTTECGVDGAMFVAEMTNVPPSDNHSLVLDSREKEMATASTGLIGNLEGLSYTTALVATVAVGCFLLILNILIFAGIYHQREKRARDAKTKEELQDNDNSKNSSMLKLNAMGSESGSYNGSGAGVSGKTTVVFGEYSCYDEKSLHTKDEKLMVELPPSQILDPSWAACSTSTLDLLKTKHHHHGPLEATSYPLSKVVPITTEQQTEHLMPVNTMEMATYNPLPMSSGLIIDPTIAAHSSGLQSKRGSFVGSSSHLNQYDFASVQSSDQMSFKDIENAVKVSVSRDDEMTQDDDDIPEPPPPPRSFQSMKHQQAQQSLQHGQQVTTNPSASGSGGTAVGGGILRQAGTSSSTQTGGGKKRVHIQEISV